MVGENLREYDYSDEDLPEPQIEITLRVPQSKSKHLMGFIRDLIGDDDVELREKDYDHG